MAEAALNFIPSPRTARATVLRGRRDPAWWIRRTLGDRPWSKQVEIMASVRDNRETAVKSCQGAGKSWNASRLVLWFLYNWAPSVVLTTAPTDRQVRGILWKEIRTAHAGARLPLGGECLTERLELAPDHWAWGFTAPEYDPEKMTGFHEENILFVIDEASGVSRQIDEAVESVLTSVNSRKLQIGNPTNPQSSFADAFKTADVSKVSICAFDTPNFTRFGITLDDIRSGEWSDKVRGRPMPRPKLVTPDWVAKRFQRWGETSPMFKARVLAEFPTQGTDSLIPLSWIEAAAARTLAPAEPVELSCDVARGGGDESVIGLRRGPVYRTLWTSHKNELMELTGEITRAMIEKGAKRARVDEVGVGGGVVDRMRELRRPVVGMNGGRKKGVDTERFLNERAEMYWNLRERFDPQTVPLIDIDPDDQELHAQLASITYKPTSAGQVQIVSKDDMKKKGLASPDRADTLAQAFARVTSTEEVRVW
jgi:hypothetical protein